MTLAGPSRVVVIGAGMAGLTAARLLADAGHVVTVLDKGRRAGGRMATRALAGGAFADYGAQFFTVRSEAFSVVVARWLDEGSVREWCRGFPSDDGHPRYVAAGGMGQLAARMTVGLDVRQSVHVDAVRKTGGRWAVTWPATRRPSAGLLEADVVVLTPPAAQLAALLAGKAEIPKVTYAPTISLLVALGDCHQFPFPVASSSRTTRPGRGSATTWQRECRRCRLSPCIPAVRSRMPGGSRTMTC